MSEPPAPRRPRSAEWAELRRDAEAAYGARLELGPEYEQHIAGGLADRVEELVAYRTAELRVRTQREDAALQDERSARTQRFVLGIVSLGAGIPITAISGAMVDPGLLGIAVAWAGIIGVNVAHALGSRRRR